MGDAGAMTGTWWPLWDLRLRSADLELAPLREADLHELVAVLPDDLELDPGAALLPGVDVATQRAVVVAQDYWRQYAAWTPASWRLAFAVRRDGRLLGVQQLKGDDFARVRTVGSFSWLVPEARGTGVGKAMRRGMLALAFGPLEAVAAVSAAWDDNHASLGVSRALGYQPNGISQAPRGERLATMLHLRLTRDQWQAAGGSDGWAVEGFPACRPLFGQ